MNSKDESYLEYGLPEYLQISLNNFKIGFEKRNSPEYLHFDCDYCDLQSSINCAEVDEEITETQAWYLREKYLGLSRNQF